MLTEGGKVEGLYGTEAMAGCNLVGWLNECRIVSRCMLRMDSSIDKRLGVCLSARIRAVCMRVRICWVWVEMGVV